MLAAQQSPEPQEVGGLDYYFPFNAENVRASAAETQVDFLLVLS